MSVVPVVLVLAQALAVHWKCNLGLRLYLRLKICSRWSLPVPLGCSVACFKKGSLAAAKSADERGDAPYRAPLKSPRRVKEIQ